jgi:hypothetical protein
LLQQGGNESHDPANRFNGLGSVWNCVSSFQKPLKSFFGVWPTLLKQGVNEREQPLLRSRLLSSWFSATTRLFRLRALRSIALCLLLAFIPSLQARPVCILLLRHAEKPPEQFDRNLDDRGRARSQALVSLLTTNQVLLAKGPISALFASKFTPRGHSRRPYETLEPLSQYLKLPVQTDFAPKDYADLASQVLKDPALNGKTVVICWVHDELPELARKLGVKPQPPAWDGKVFDRVWMITYRKNRAILTDLPQALMPGDSAR